MTKTNTTKTKTNTAKTKTNTAKTKKLPVKVLAVKKAPAPSLKATKASKRISDEVDTTALCGGLVPAEIAPVKGGGRDRIYHVAQVTCPDGTKIQKRFLVDKLPTHAVVTPYAKTKQNHILTWSRNPKLCESHIKRVEIEYMGNDATKIKNFYSSATLVEVQDLGIQTSPLDPELVEDKTWLRVQRAKERLAKEASNPGTLTALSVIVAERILSNVY